MRNTVAFLILPACLLTGTLSLAHVSLQQTAARPELAGVLDFEAQHSADLPKGWGGGPAGTFAVDGQIVHGGRWALRIERDEKSPGGFTSVTKMIPVDFAGTSLELRGFLRTQDVSQFAGLWMREDGDSGGVAFDNMQGRQLKGTTEWTEYSITLPLQKAAKRLYFGVLAAGVGKVWADDLRLLVDGRPIENEPRIELPKTVLDLDREFDGGTAVALKSLSPIQVANLAMLGKVWGFVKYHHPLIAAGKRHWDYELFRVLPKVLAAADAPAARSAVYQWVAALGDLPRCTTCASLQESDLQLRPASTWLTDDALGSELGGMLRAIHRNRPADQQQFYLSLAPGIGNPSFDHELAYGTLTLPDAGYQLLALYRLWNIVEYWFPYRNLLERSWDDELTAFIPRIALASSVDEYKRQLLAFVARIHDTHANLWSSLDARPPVGSCSIPVTMRVIENQMVVAGTTGTASPSASALQRGDVVTALDGVSVTALIERWSPFYAASNQPTRLRDIAASLTRGACGATTIGVSRGNESLTVKAERIAVPPPGSAPRRTHDRTGDTFQKLSPEVAYLKLSSVQASQAAAYIEEAAGTKGLIIDIRNYPSEFVVFALGSHLVDRPTEFARFTIGDPANPGAFHWRGTPLSLVPTAPRYMGKVVILVDESSLSQAEYTAMAFRSAPNAVVVGSTTAGADGNVSPIPLPGGLQSMISGIGVFYPDKRPTQRIGIVPDIDARPTIQGIRSGRDEVLEAALRHILGAGVSAAEIERLAKQ
jgi:C-terminal processing protease CtpA/Prc